jgi:hypothetical protein
MKYIFLSILCSSAFADLEVIKPDYSHKSITLKIIRAYPGGLGTYTLINHNSREMSLVCAGNRFYGDNPKPVIEYRNFYNERVADFTIASNKVCFEMGKFIEAGHMAIDEETPFIIELDRKNASVTKIVYPKVDVLSDTGEMKDLMPKSTIRITVEEKKIEDKKVEQVLKVKPIE